MFLLVFNRYKVKQCLPNSRIFFKKAEKDGLHNGRAKNGMFIDVPMEIKEFAKEVNTFNWRTKALTRTFPENKIMIINSYFPTDPKVNEFDINDLLCRLSTINDVLSNTDFDSLIWTGDINADFIRQTQFTKIIDELIEEKALKSWNKFPVDFTHLQEIRNRTNTSTLDHFFWSERLSESIVNADVLHLPENTSDHCPIFCSIDLDRLGPIVTEKKIPKSSKASWIKATDAERSNYVDTLTNRLRSLDIPPCTGCCLNDNCSSEGHREECDDLLISLLQSIESSADDCLQNNIRKSPIAFWKEDVQPFKDCS